MAKVFGIENSCLGSETSQDVAQEHGFSAPHRKLEFFKPRYYFLHLRLHEAHNKVV